LLLINAARSRQRETLAGAIAHKSICPEMNQEMSPENIEKRIADLEQSLGEAHQTITAMFGLVNVLADFQKTATEKLYDWIISLESRNSEALQLLGQSLSETEVRQKLGDILARNVTNRDQIEAMLQKFKTLHLLPPHPPAPPTAPGT